MNICVKRLATARGGKLRKLVNNHLRKLTHFLIAHTGKIGSERNIKRVPTDSAGKVSLQYGTEAHHVQQKHFGVSRRMGGIDCLWQIQTVDFQILQGLTTAVRAIDITQAMYVDIARYMCLAGILGKNIKKRKLLFYALSKD